MIRQLIGTFLLAGLLSGCDASLVQPRYQLYVASDGKVYRLDVKTGTVHYVTSDGMFALSDVTPKLQLGQYFQMEDGKFLKYLGKGQFEKSDIIIRKRE